MKIKILALLTGLLLLLAAAGCSSPVPQSRPGEGVRALYSVTDATGTRLSFFERPQRIVSLNVSVDEILLELVEPERIAGLSAMCDDASLCNAGSRVKTVRGRASSTDIEGVMALQPDLVIIPDYTMTPVNALRSAGLKVYVCRTPDNIQDIFRFIESVGEAAGEAERGARMAGAMEKRLESLRRKVLSQVPEQRRLRVLALSFMGPMGMKGTFSDLCYYAGVSNALQGIDIPYEGNLSEEKLLELNPDMIITPSWDYSRQGDPEQFRQKILHNPLYRDVKAVKNGRVVMLHDNYLYSTSQYTVMAAEELAQAAYPELFE